jgi:uncharacterized MAPEG superfamily protein
MTLIGFVVWTAVMTLVLVGVRGAAVAAGKPLNSFAPDGRDLGPLGQRVTRAHANSLENLAPMIGMLLYAIAARQTAVTDGLAPVALAARVLQSSTHVASMSKPAVLLRGQLYFVQVFACLYWAWRFSIQ